jgi:hypothetical protein
LLNRQQSDNAAQLNGPCFFYGNRFHSADNIVGFCLPSGNVPFFGGKCNQFFFTYLYLLAIGLQAYANRYQKQQ